MTIVGPLVYNNFCIPFYVGSNSDPDEVADNAVVTINNEIYKNYGGELNTKHENDFRGRMKTAVASVKEKIDQGGDNSSQLKIKITIIIKNKSITIIIEF